MNLMYAYIIHAWQVEDWRYIHDLFITRHMTMAGNWFTFSSMQVGR